MVGYTTRSLQSLPSKINKPCLSRLLGGKYASSPLMSMLTNIIPIFDAAILYRYGREHGCAPAMSPAPTPFDGGARNVACNQYEQCINGKVMLCFFDGSHGDWFGDIERLTFWFVESLTDDLREAALVTETYSAESSDQVTGSTTKSASQFLAVEV